MKKPITVTVHREHGNSGDCILTATDANGEKKSHNAPGDCSAYSALTTVREFIEGLLNAEVAAPVTKPQGSK